MVNQIFAEYYKFIEWKLYQVVSESYEFLVFESRLSTSEASEKFFSPYDLIPFDESVTRGHHICAIVITALKWGEW